PSVPTDSFGRNPLRWGSQLWVLSRCDKTARVERAKRLQEPPMMPHDLRVYRGKDGALRSNGANAWDLQESQGDSLSRPRVARHAPTWVPAREQGPTATRLRPFHSSVRVPGSRCPPPIRGVPPRSTGA